MFETFGMLRWTTLQVIWKQDTFIKPDILLRKTYDKIPWLKDLKNFFRL